MGMQEVTRDNWKELTAQAGISFEELAARTGMSWGSVASYRSGRRRPKDAWIAKVAAIVAERAA